MGNVVARSVGAWGCVDGAVATPCSCVRAHLGDLVVVLLHRQVKHDSLGGHAGLGLVVHIVARVRQTLRKLEVPLAAARMGAYTVAQCEEAREKTGEMVHRRGESLGVVVEGSKRTRIALM